MRFAAPHRPVRAPACTLLRVRGSRPVVFGTAGHIDHGKTTLVRALTGHDCDRLDEEKRRGITIVLGFAPFVLPDGREASFIDVPGHERFVRTMLAGAGGIDVALLVVSAEEGVMPQTREHLAILELLAVPRLVVALTRCDVVEPELRELAALDVADRLATTPWPDATIHAVSALTGEGIEALRAALVAAAAPVADPDADLRSGPHEAAFRLPIDRQFPKRGFGTVVTGTAWSGTVKVGQAVEIGPGSMQARVRGLQVHGRAVEEAHAGSRVAINLQGVEVGDLAAGSWVLAPGSGAPSSALDVEIRILADAPRPVESGDHLRVHHGTAEVLATVLLLPPRAAEGAPEALLPGDAARARLLLASPLLCRAGDRFVLRAESPVVTVGGGRVLDPCPPDLRRRQHEGHAAWLDVLADPASTLEARLGAVLGRHVGSALGRAQLRPYLEPGADLDAALDGCVTSGSAVRVAGEPPTWTSTLPVAAWVEPARVYLASFHEAHPLLPGALIGDLRSGLATRVVVPAFEALLPVLVAALGARLRSNRVALPTFDEAPSPVLRAQLDAAVSAIDLAGLGPPAWTDVVAHLGLPPDSLSYLVDRGEVVRIAEDYHLSRRQLSMLATKVVQFFDRGAATLSPAEFKGISGLSRRHAIPLLEHLDRGRLTSRQGDLRLLRDRLAFTHSSG